jgi:hypothetical protein
MPPVSVTMHPTKLPAAEPVAGPDAAGALDEADVLAAGALLVLLGLDELLPHAAISRVAAPAAAIVATNEVCLTFPPLDQIADAQA